MARRIAARTLPAVLLLGSVGTGTAAAARSTGLPAECAPEGARIRCLFTQPAAIATVFTVPAGVVNLSVSARGGSGGPGDADQQSDCADGPVSLPRAGSVEGARGGLGGVASAVLNVEPGQVLDLYVGGVGASATGITGGAGGVNGGAPGGTVRIEARNDLCDPFNQFGGGGGGGGGGSFVMAHGTLPPVAVPLLAAGGGGGGGGTYAATPGGTGGGGGGPTGDAGDGGRNRGLGGSDRGGRGGPGADSGTRGTGGLGAASLSAPGAGGGGGGGYFGGGGGGSSVPADELSGAAVRMVSGGGGGGSGFVAGTGPGVRLYRGTVGLGSVSGPGEIAISWTPPDGAALRTPDPATAGSVQRAVRRRRVG
jgi:hypothetical protein